MKLQANRNQCGLNSLFSLDYNLCGRYVVEIVIAVRFTEYV
jgi:hypothetical protein